jgi:hypothetical protein
MAGPARLLTLGMLSLALCWTLAASASAATYAQTQTTAVPPSSNFTANSGGDGWDVSLSADKVYNVFHHGYSMTVACHLQSDGSVCPGYPSTVADGFGRGFQTAGEPGTLLDQATGKLYVYGTRDDLTAGVVCFDTAAPVAPFCGFSALSGTGEAGTFGWSALGGPAKVGTRVYAFNYVQGEQAGGASGTGSQNRLLCFDLSTAAACAGQPYSVNVGSGTANYVVPSPNAAAIGNEVIIPVSMSDGGSLACFDTIAHGDCGGVWPASLASSAPYYFGYNGSPFPLLDGTGAVTGVCVPTYDPSTFGAADPCFNLTGATTATPAGMTDVISPTSPWNGPSVTLGPRVYVPNGNGDVVQCYDYSTSSSCSGFPKHFDGLGYLYTVNRDPQRPTCLWVNADYGDSQIQNFDAYSGGACGTGSTRVLTSQFVVPQQECYPTAYESLQVLSPDRSAYTGGTVEFADGAGNPITTIPSRNLDASGAVDLTGLDLNTAAGLPQFIITLDGAPADVGQLAVKLTWTDSYDPACVAPGTTVQKEATTLTTSLSGGGHSGAQITVLDGTSVTDSATLTGTNSSTASGTVTYTWYSDSSCSTVASDGSAQAITTPGTLPASEPVILPAGTYHVIAGYSGDDGNLASASSCADEVLTVGSSNAAPQVDQITGATSADEGATRTYSVSASDPDHDTLTYEWSVTAGEAHISGPADGSSADVTFTDGPSPVTVQVNVGDGHSHSVTRTLNVSEHNVAPTASITGGDARTVNESSTARTFDYTISDPGADAVTSAATSCGTGGEKVINSDTHTDTTGSFRCVFADGPASPTVSAQATDSDGDAGATDTQSVTVANVAPTTTLSPANPSSLQESAAERTFSYSISDPGQDTVTSVATSCGSGGQKVSGSDANTDTSGSFSCVFVNGPASPTVSARATDSDGEAGNTASQTVTITDPAISAQGVTLTGTEASAIAGKVGTFSDPTSYSTAAEYTASITWGDGTTSAGTITKIAPGAFDVSGSHAYAEENASGYVVKVKITDADNAPNTATATSSAVIADAAIHATVGAAITTSLVYNGPLATFTDDAGGPKSDFSAIVTWGDGSATSAGVITGPIAGKFTVSGSHTYATSGSYTITVKVNDVGGSTDSASTAAVVYQFATAANASFSISDKMAVPGGKVTWWGGQWEKLNTFSNGVVGSSGFKGFIDATATKVAPTCATTWTSTNPGGSSALPASVPAYMAVVVASRESKSGSKITGDVKRVVVVKTDAGYGPDTTRPGTGTVVGSVC